MTDLNELAPINETIVSYNDYVYPKENAVMYHPPKLPGGGPPCIWDNGPTMRNGSCYICVLCGSTSACG